LRYSKRTGLFRWIARTTPRAHRIEIGAIAGHADTAGHLQICIHGRFYAAHRLAVFYVTGRWPKADVDHKNRVRSDNRWKNLRAATRSQNIMNSKKYAGKAAALKGVCYYPKTGKYAARLKRDGKHFYLGLFDTPMQAHAAYRRKARLLFGKFARFS
jgi:hypothetical protein